MISKTSSSINARSTQETNPWIWGTSWRILIVATGYMLASMVTGWLLGRNVEWGQLGLSLLSGILIGLTLCPIAARMQGSRLRHFVVWGSVLFLNTFSVMIEGAFYAPTHNPFLSMPIPWIALTLFQSSVTAALISRLFAPNALSITFTPLGKRVWYSWIWRFLLSAFSYLVFYFIFGAINYALVTKPYYETHVSGLVVPSPQIVLIAEMVRAPLIVLAIVPLILTLKMKKRWLAVLCGMILFVIGGIIPLLLNTALPDFLRFASVIEIFFQNFLTGVVAVALLGFALKSESLGK